jgi:hypothetical protein
MKALQLLKTYVDSAESLGYTFDDVTNTRSNPEDIPANALNSQTSSRRQIASSTIVSPLTIIENVLHGVSNTSTMNDHPETSYGSNGGHERNSQLDYEGQNQNNIPQPPPFLRRASSFHSQASSTVSRSANVWEKDENSMDCRRCGRYFSLLLRRHHCRYDDDCYL